VRESLATEEREALTFLNSRVPVELRTVMSKKPAGRFLMVILAGSVVPFSSCRLICCS
jgi:hypothetical protein